MFCTQCGEKIADDSRFCSYCGAATSRSERQARSAGDEPANGTRSQRQAQTVVPTARALAVSSFASVVNEPPAVDRVSRDDWDFFVTIACVFVAASAVSRLRDPEAEDLALEVITSTLNDWNEDALRAFDDCKQMFEQTFDELASSPAYQNDRRFLTSDSVGLWIAWNLLGQKPSSADEYKLVRTAGVLTTAGFANWWDGPQHVA